MRSFFKDIIHYWKIINPLLVLLILSICVSAMIYKLTASNSPKYLDNYRTFFSMSFGIDSYIKYLPVSWKARIFSSYLANKLMPAIKVEATSEDIDQEKFKHGVGLWSAIWFFSACLFLNWCFKRDSLFFIFGLYAAIAFDYEFSIAPMVYPWDMPSLFFYVVFIVLLEKNRLKWLLIILPFAMGFKETAMIPGIVFFFMKDVSLKKRSIFTLISLFSCFLIKMLIGLWLKLPDPFFTMDGTGTEKFHLIRNFGYLKNPFQHFIFCINAGTLLSFLFLPSRKYPFAALKIICVFFLTGIFFSGNILEYRIFLELVPINLYGIYLFFKDSVDACNVKTLCLF